MEETLTDCLVRVREDLSQLKQVREYLDSNTNFQGSCLVTWRTIEAFNSILAVSFQEKSCNFDVLDTLLDSFYFLARNNEDAEVWSDFGFELGIICGKILSAIEQTEMFDVFFHKLLSVLNVICEHSSDVWKAMARQILNVFINKKLSVSYFQTILELYNSTLRRIKGEELYNFSLQNLHLLKTFSKFVQKMGDFEIQMNIMELVILHTSNDKKITGEFFAEAKDEARKVFHSLKFIDFEGDCRKFLNSLNKHRLGFDKKVYSICCHILYFGGCFMEPLPNRKSIWVDANKESERLSIKCADSQSDASRIIYIQFPDIVTVQVDNEKSEGNYCVTIRTTNLRKINRDVKNDNILCVALEQENTREGILGFVKFLEQMIGGDRKNNKTKKYGKMSKTKDHLFIDRSFAQDAMKEEVQDNAISSSVKSTGSLGAFQKAGRVESQLEINSLVPNTQEKPPVTPVQDKAKRDFVLETQEMTPNSFLESLNRHLGMDSSEVKHSFEDSVETVMYFEGKKSHKLFRSPQTIFKILETEEKPNFIFGENKENEAPGGKTTNVEEPKPMEEKESPISTRVLRDRKNLVVKLSDTQSQEYFRQNVGPHKKKPSLPRLNRKKSTKKTPADGGRTTKVEVMTTSKATDTEIKKEAQKKTETKPSLLDPNGYAFQRWLKPTTSERSNFWLRKLNAAQKQKECENVFEFSDESDSDMNKYRKRRKRRSGKSRKNFITKSTTNQNKPSSGPKEVKKAEEPIRRKTSPLPKGSQNKEEEWKEMPKGDNQEVEGDIQGNPDMSRESGKDPEKVNFEYATGEDAHPQEKEQSECESLLSSDDENRNEKREHSETDNSLRQTIVKKKRRTKELHAGVIQSVLRRRLQKVEERSREETDEIIDTVNSFARCLLKEMQKKEGRKIGSYLNKMEETMAALEEMNDLELRSKRTQRIRAYFQDVCSISNYCDSMEAQSCKIREALQELISKSQNSRRLSRMNQLKDLIGAEIDKSIESEMATYRKRLLQCASAFDPGSEDVL